MRRIVEDPDPDRRAAALESLLEDCFETVDDPWVLLSAVRDGTGAIVDFEYVEANRAACDYNRRTREEMIGSRLLSVLPGHQGGMLEVYARIVETGEPYVRDALEYSVDGEDRWFTNRGRRVGEDHLSFLWRDVTEEVLAHRRLAKQAHTDPLTGLLNRAGLDRAVEHLVNDRRVHHGVALLYLDVDGLAALNNTHGHPAGDAVLRAVADRIGGASRSGDVVARVGGDEFLVLAPGADDTGAQLLGEKIATAVQRSVHLPDGGSVVPTISVGIAVGRDDQALAELVAAADQEMLQRKRELYAVTERRPAP